MAIDEQVYGDKEEHQRRILKMRRFKTEYLAVPMFALQVLFYLLHTGGYWVA